MPKAKPVTDQERAKLLEAHLLVLAMFAEQDKPERKPPESERALKVIARSA